MSRYSDRRSDSYKSIEVALRYFKELKMKNAWGDEIPERTKLDIFLIKYDRKITGLACVLGFVVGAYIGNLLFS